MCLHSYLFWLKLTLPSLYLVLAIVFACLSAMIALLFLVVFATALVVDGADAFGHIVAVTLSSVCPWWPYEFAIAGVGMSVWILFQDDSHWYCFSLRFLKLIFVDVNFVQQNALAINYFI